MRVPAQHICDICKENYPDAKIKYKYRAKRHWSSWWEESWYRIELCQECLDKIIKGVQENSNEQ